MDEIKKVITIEVNGDQTVKSLKQEINDLRDALLNTQEGSEEYKKTLDQLIEDQKKLTSVMNAGKKEIEAAEGSYNALRNEMTALKKVWREVTDEASRNEIGTRILEINDQLKGMDASIGDFQRNVGNYEGALTDATKNIMQNLGNISPELGKLGRSVGQMIPIIQKTNKVATTGLKGVKKAITATGIGALITALGLLVANWDKVSEAISKVIPWAKKHNEEAEKTKKLTEELIAQNKAATEEMEFQTRIMAAQGKSQLEIIKYKKLETEALIENTKAQIAENEAKLASLKAHSAFGRWIRGERKEYKALNESIEKQTDELNNLNNALKKLNQDYVVEETKVEYQRSQAAKNGSNDRIAIEKKTAKSRLDELQSFIDKAKTLEEGYYSDEEMVAKDYAENQETVIKGLYASILSTIKSNNIPNEVSNLIKQINGMPLPDSIKEKIKNVFSDIDFTKSGTEITNSIRQGLDKIDLTGVSKQLQDQFKNFINTVDIEEIGPEMQEKLNSIFSNVDFTDILNGLKELFASTPEINAILDQFIALWGKVQQENEKNLKQLSENEKKANSDRVKNQLESLEKENANRLAYYKEEIEQEKEQATIAFDLSKGRYADRVRLRQAQYEAEKKYADSEIQVMQEELDEYRRVLNEENLTDEETIALKEEIANKEIELIRKVREEREKDHKKRQEDIQEEKNELQERLSDISNFADSVGEILGSVADYWLDQVKSQVEAGEMSEAEGKRQFEWIKRLQVAETTVQTLAAAMAAFNGITQSTGGWGIAAAAAKAAAVMTAGALKIAQIKNTQLSNKTSNLNASTSQGAQIRTITTDYAPQYVAPQTSATETSNLANALSQQNIFVSVTDINNVQNKVRVREEESTW